MKINKAFITATLAAGSAASPYYYNLAISDVLCRKTCAEASPIFAPVFSVVSTENVGTNQYEVTVNVQGTITYHPCNSCECKTLTQMINQNFVLPVYSATAPTAVTVTAGTVQNEIVTEPCVNCSKNFLSNIPLSLTVTTA